MSFHFGQDRTPLRISGTNKINIDCFSGYLRYLSLTRKRRYLAACVIILSQCFGQHGLLKYHQHIQQESMRQRERKGPWLILLKVLIPVHVYCTSLSETGCSGLKGLVKFCTNIEEQ